MATLVLTAIGTAIGGPVGGAIGALIGRSIDGKLFAPAPREGGRLSELKLTTSSYGMPLPRHFGRMRVAGQVIWATDLVEHRERQGGGKRGPATTAYSYSASFAVALSSRPLRSVERVWADGKLLRGAAGELKVGGQFRFYPGHRDQMPDPLIASAEPAGQCPAYRGTAYVVFEDLQLAEFGNRIPSLTFEVLADEALLNVADLVRDTVANCTAAIPLDGLAGLTVDGPLAEALDMLAPFHPVSIDVSGSALTLRAEGDDPAPPSLPEAALSIEDDAFGRKTGFSQARGADPEVPVGVLRYYDIDRDYQPGTQHASGRPLPGQPLMLDLPAAMAATEARQLLNRTARRARSNRQTLSWRMAALDPKVSPGATVLVPGHPGRWRVRTWEWRESGIELGLVRLPPLVMVDLSADPGRALPPSDHAPGLTHLAVCELPWDSNSVAAQPLILALASSSSPAWPGASLQLDTGDGSLLPLGPTGRARATIGTATTVLPTASPLLFDRHSQIDVTLVADDLDLANATMRQLAIGANRAVLGAEIIQFARAAPLGGGSWRLSGLWRGRGGTEHAISAHEAGERFILLDGSGIALDPATIGAAPTAQIIALGMADAEPVTSSIALRGIALRPLAPVHGGWSRQEDGNYRLSWTRRGRGSWLWLDGVDTPLIEQAENYDITFGQTGAIHARWNATEPSLAFSAAELDSLHQNMAQGRFEIRQRGDWALSEPLAVALPNP